MRRPTFLAGSLAAASGRGKSESESPHTISIPPPSQHHQPPLESRPGYAPSRALPEVVKPVASWAGIPGPNYSGDPEKARPGFPARV